MIKVGGASWLESLPWGGGEGKMLGGRPAFGQGKDHWEVVSDRFESISGLGVPGAERAT